MKCRGDEMLRRRDAAVGCGARRELLPVDYDRLAVRRDDAARQTALLKDGPVGRRDERHGVRARAPARRKLVEGRGTLTAVGMQTEAELALVPDHGHCSSEVRKNGLAKLPYAV